MQDHHLPGRQKNPLQRTAGPYIRVSGSKLIFSRLIHWQASWSYSPHRLTITLLTAPPRICPAIVLFQVPLVHIAMFPSERAIRSDVSVL